MDKHSESMSSIMIKNDAVYASRTVRDWNFRPISSIDFVVGPNIDCLDVFLDFVARGPFVMDLEFNGVDVERMWRSDKAFTRYNGRILIRSRIIPGLNRLTARFRFDESTKPKLNGVIDVEQFDWQIISREQGDDTLKEWIECAPFAAEA